MKVVISCFLGICLLLFSLVLHSKPYGATLCNTDDRYFCYKVKSNDSWEKLFKDPDLRAIVMRVNRMNINIYRGMVIAIPKDLGKASLIDYSPFEKQINPPGEKVIFVSLHPSKLAWGAYDSDGVLQAWGPVSGGQDYCRDIRRGCRTQVGNFSIYSKQGAGCKSRKFPIGRGGAPMPYCMFFNGGFALHGSYDVPGYNASHGCVRMMIDDAKWLNQEFTAGEENVPVIVTRDI